METPLDDRAQKRARLSLLFGLIWLISPLIWLSWTWLSRGPLEPILPGSLSLAGVALANIMPVIERTGFILWAEIGMACVMTAFPEPKNPRSWQGKTAVFLAVLVLVGFVLLAFLYLVYFSMYGLTAYSHQNYS